MIRSRPPSSGFALHGIQANVWCSHTALVVLSALAACADQRSSTAPATTATKLTPSASTGTGATDEMFPLAFAHGTPRGERFIDPNYSKWFAGSAIRTADPKALFARMQSATTASERYKALYFARIFTQAVPENAAGWSNRAALARKLGFTAEADASDANSHGAGPLTAPPLEPLPGATTMPKPASLHDWAAAVALMADAVAQRSGPTTLVAIEDTVSGVHQATQQELDAVNRERKEEEVAPTGPWVEPVPMKLQHVLPNAFVLRSALPMSEKSMNLGSMLGAFAMAGASGYQQNYNPAAAQQSMDLADELAGKSLAVAATHKGGSYSAVTYRDGKEVISKHQPKASGEDATVGLPVPLLWASGASLSATFVGTWGYTSTPWIRTITPADVASGTEKTTRIKQMRPPSVLHFPKLMRLCVGTLHFCSVPVTLMEVMLTRDDVAAFAPGLETKVDTDVAFNAASYDADTVLIQASNFDDERMAAFDERGTVYVMKPSDSAHRGIGPLEWLVSFSTINRR